MMAMVHRHGWSPRKGGHAAPAVVLQGPPYGPQGLLQVCLYGSSSFSLWVCSAAHAAHLTRISSLVRVSWLQQYQGPSSQCLSLGGGATCVTTSSLPIRSIRVQHLIPGPGGGQHASLLHSSQSHQQGFSTLVRSPTLGPRHR